MNKKNLKDLKKNPLVVYLLYYPIAQKTLKDFIKYYKRFNSGKKHQLLICFKGFNYNLKSINFWKKKIPLRYTFYLDKELNNDFDIGSFFRVATDFPGRLILFLNSYAYPNCKDWLKIFINNYEVKSVVGGHGSFGSISSQCLSFKYKNLTFWQSIKYGIIHLINSSIFPNPHIRTSNFLINSNDFISLKINQYKFTNKIHTNYFESGRNGMFNQLLKRNFKLFLVNTDNKKFLKNSWDKSQTAFLGNQEKLVISDHRTREFNLLSNNKKKELTKINWGRTTL